MLYRAMDEDAVMTDSDEQRALPEETQCGSPPDADERDAIIERLERALAEEREHSASLRTTIDNLRFQLDILERSYSKQLTDARHSSEAAELEVLDLRARIDELEAAARAAAESPPQDNNLTINELIDGAGWSREQRPAGYEDDIVPAEPEPPAEEMIAPDLVFTNERDDNAS